MLEALKSDDLLAKVGGRFKLCTLIQRRLGQLMDGARPLVERDGRSDLELGMDEILQDKITLGWTGEEGTGSAEEASSPTETGALL
ncbi:MAG: DNA-directed RNA polymerase subunit omega [Phycisphaerales bacterium]|nr:DNA-directed RNA polymerase subunit omega [Phycisphaerales bacterium]